MPADSSTSARFVPLQGGAKVELSRRQRQEYREKMSLQEL